LRVTSAPLDYWALLTSLPPRRQKMASELKMKIVELEARAEAAEMKLKTSLVGMRKAQQELEEAQANIKKNEDRVNQAETRAGENERKGRNLLQRVHELEGQLEGIKKDKAKFELQAEEVRGSRVLVFVRLTRR
jgi:chromosome segregation ATPase